MENIIYADSPLAAYLEGEGKGDEPWITLPAQDAPTEPPNDHSQQQDSFAPTGRPTFASRIGRRLPQPLKLKIPNDGPVARIHEVCSRAVNSRLGRADNARFLEHFRYILVASQLLTEQYGHANNRHSAIPNLEGSGAHLEEYKAAATSVTGALVTATTAFAVVWLMHWSRAGRQNGVGRGRILIVIAAFLVLAIVLYAYARRQWLQYLRQNAVTAASTLVTNLQAFDSSSSAALGLVQEVELVSRGYRLSTPLPPITRLDEKSQGRRCSRIRRCLGNAFAANIPPLRQACDDLRILISQDDLEKYLDVYDITYQDIQEASLGFSDSEFDDLESLKTLRILQARFSTLRRVFLCSLLSLEADGGKPDFPRWRTAVDAMECVTAVTGEHAEKLNLLLAEEETFNIPTPVTPHLRSKQDPERERFRTQIRKLGSLSSGIRGLQAKLQILREESTKSLEEADMDLVDLGPSLMSQYDSIGADLKSLVQAWESGKASLALNLDRHESRRISQASSGLRSPVPSLGGLTAVDEMGGSPSEALRALNGELPLPSASSGSAASPAGSASDEEIFEAIAIPKTRQSMSREQRMAKMQEERERMASFRERREQGLSMVRELESVMNARGPRRRPATTYGRITSI